MKIKFKKILKRLFVCFLVVALLIFLPMFKLASENNLDLIFNAFVGAKSKYQGIIVVWNVDCFESGTAPKSNFLNSVARNFERENKGTYVLVKNMTEFECLCKLEKGEMPDLFSCSYSLAKKIKNYVCEFSGIDKISIDSNLLSAGMVDGKLMALAWCKGIYCLLTTSEKLSLAGKDLKEGVSLSSIALESGFETKKNPTKVISSLTFGANSTLMPQIAFSSYNDTKLETAQAITLDKNSFTQTQYSAYASFLAGNSTILLGTQRDIARLENRLDNGKIKDILYQPLFGKCDLVQFCLLSDGEDKLRRDYAESFAIELTSLRSQKKINEIGMIPVNCSINPYEKGVMRNIVSQNSSDYEVFHIFE